MRRSLWIVILVLVLGGFAGIQQYSSWSLSKAQVKSADTSGDNAEGRPAGGGQGRSGGQGRGGASREAVPVLVATAVQKTVPV